MNKCWIHINKMERFFQKLFLIFQKMSIKINDIIMLFFELSSIHFNSSQNQAN